VSLLFLAANGWQLQAVSILRKNVKNKKSNSTKEHKEDTKSHEDYIGGIFKAYLFISRCQSPTSSWALSSKANRKNRSSNVWWKFI